MTSELSRQEIAMKRLLGLLGLCLTLLVWPVACSQPAPPTGPEPAASRETSQAPRIWQEPRCSYGRVPTADRRLITAALQERFAQVPDNTYEVLGVYYGQPQRGARYAFLAVLRVYGIAGPSILLLDQVTGDFDRRTRLVSDLARNTFDRTRCPEIPTP